MEKNPNQENLSSDKKEKSVYHFYDKDLVAVFKTKEILKNTKILVFYPFNVNRSSGQITPKKIRTIEFRGWEKIEELPKDFRKTAGYGFTTPRAKQFLSILYKKFPTVNKLVIGINIQNRFSKNTITLSFGSLEKILKQLGKEKFNYDRNRKILTYHLLSELTGKVESNERTLTAGDLDYFLSKYNSFENISVKDVDSLTKVLSDLPMSKITSTSHIIKTKEKIDIIYLDDIIKHFEKLMKVTKDNEESWQSFFEEHTWTLSHLFPYEVILRKGKAYVGGKTIENDEGRIVDFLFETGFKDNFALLEIKTHTKQLLKPTPYRKPAVFPISDELSGGINQCLDQKDVFLRDLGKQYKSLDPKTILVIGQKQGMTPEQIQCFELFRANQKNVGIITFDELLHKLVGLYEVITGKKRLSAK